MEDQGGEISSSSLLEDGLRHLQLEQRTLEIAKFIEKYRNSRKFESSCVTNLVTRPITRSLSQILSEYYTANYGFDLKVVDLLPHCCEGEPIYLEGGVQVRWFHLNFSATIKDDDDCDGDSWYFAEVVSYRFGPLFPLHCKVVLSHAVALEKSCECKCLLGTPHSSIRHPATDVFADPLIRPARSAALDILAFKMLPQFYGNKRRRKRETIGVLLSPIGPVMATPTPSSKSIASLEERRLETPSIKEGGRRCNGGPIVCLGIAKGYLYKSKKSIEMAIPNPKEYLLLEGESKDIGLRRLVQRRELALAMAKRIENYGKPRPARNLTMETLLDFLPACHTRKYGVDLEAMTDLKLQQSVYIELRREARWFHLNFNAKRKLDDGGDSVNLYFAEVVKITVFYPPRYPSKYIMTVCVAVDENDAAGNSSKCRMCSQRAVQMCHPGPDLYDSSCEMDPSKFKFWKKAAEFLEYKFPPI